MSAPEDSPVLPILFANRSAALFKMGRFTDCVEDIDEALRLGYPEKLQYKVVRLVERWREKNKSKFGNVIFPPGFGT